MPVARGTAYNLPLQPTPLLGRERELDAAEDRLLQAEVRLLTLTGPGGTGKTRLALALADALVDEFEEGVAFIDLSPLSEPEQVASAITQALNIHEAGSGTPLELLKDALHSRHQLLLLDNFEQLLPAATLLAELLASCPKLKLLVTSRAPLKLRWEHEFAVPPLDLPNLGALPPLELLQEVPAVALFVRRARAAVAGFELTEANAGAVAGICHHLDGLPLALELAAPRLKLFSPQELLRRLEGHLDLLSAHASDLPTRQQTLYAEIDWSYGLLSEEEQALFRWLGVFVGGFSAEAAPEVCGGTETDVLKGLSALVDQSLLRVESADGKMRFRMLETIREFALEKLVEHQQEKVRVEERHASYYLHLLQRWGSELQGARQQEASKTLEQELKNIRAAWKCIVAQRRAEVLRRSATPIRSHYERAGRYREGMELLNQAKVCLDETVPVNHAALGEVLVNQAWLWFRLGNYEEALLLARRSLALVRPLETNETLVEVLFTLGAILRRTGDYAEAKGFLEEGLSLTREREHPFYTARTLNFLALVEQSLGNYAHAQGNYEEALAIHRRLHDHALVATILNNLGNMLVDLGRPEEAQPLLLEGIRVARDYDFKQTLPYLLSSLGSALYHLGEYAQAVPLNEEALDLVRQTGERWVEAFILTDLGHLAMAVGNHAQAQSYLQQSLRVAWTIGSMPMVLRALIRIAELQVDQRQTKQAASLLSLALRHPATSKVERDVAEHLLADLKNNIPFEILADDLEKGATLKLEEVVEKQLVKVPATTDFSTLREASSQLSRANRLTGVLSERETQVLKLVAEGLTNKGIASGLGISEKTVARHLENVFNKLGVSSRAAATAFAVREGILPDRRTSETG